jgi:hypothetical protein
VEEADWASWAKNTEWAGAAALAGWADKGEKNQKGFDFRNWIDFRIWHDLEFLQGDLEGIWTEGFFLNSYRLLKDF